MDFYEFRRLLTKADSKSIIHFFKSQLDIKVDNKLLDRKIDAKGYIPEYREYDYKPWQIIDRRKYFFNIRFFTMLDEFPAVDLIVKESKSHIRKTSYGFRDKISQERVYVRFEGDSIVVFRDNPAGFLTAKRYLVESLSQLHVFSFKAVFNKLKKVLRKKGILVTIKEYRSYIDRNKPRYKLAAVLLWNRIKKRTEKTGKRNEKSKR